MRTGVAFCLTVLMTACACGSDAVSGWLDKASDSSLSYRQREYAARQILMLAEDSASILLAAVRQENPENGLRRQVAAGLLGELPLEYAENVLIEAAFAQDYFLAEAASASLVRLYARQPAGFLYALFKRGGREAEPAGAETDDWLRLSLQSAQSRTRFRTIVMKAIARKYADSLEDMPPLLAECVWEGLRDGDAKLRGAAVAAVPGTRSNQAADKLAAAISIETDPSILAGALKTMAALRPSMFRQAVERHTGHAEPLVALEALGALYAMGDETVLVPMAPGQRSIAGFVVHPSTPVRRRAIEMMGETKDPVVLNYLAAGLNDRVPANRALAARMLGRLGLAGASGVLTSALGDGHPSVRAEAAIALAGMGVVGTSNRLVQDLRSDSLPFRWAAATALGNIGDESAIPALTALLEDDTVDSETACLAVEALVKIRPAKDLGPLYFAVLTGTGDEMVRDAARAALETVYGEDPGMAASGWEGWRIRNRME